MITKENKACEYILDFDRKMKKLFEGENPLRKALMGKYGELLVADEFKKRGFSVEVEGNLTSYDLIIEGKKVEIRTSEVKRERAFPKSIKAWGWKLQTNDRNRNPKELKYDVIVLVQLFDDWKKYNLYILSREEVESMRITSFSGYQTVARGIYLFENDLEEARKVDRHEMITEKCEDFNNHPKKYLLKWGRMKDIFKSR